MYKILIKSEAELSVCTGTYETYKSAKMQMQKMVVHLITQNDAYDEGVWKQWKKQFPEDVQTVLTSLEKSGSAPAGDYNTDGEVGNNWFCLRDNDLEIDIADEDEDAPAYQISTDLFESDEEAESHCFYLWSAGEALIIMMLDDKA